MIRTCMLALLFGSLVGSAYAQEVRVTLVGEVDLNLSSTGPYAGVSKGSQVVLTMLAEVPGTVTTPGVEERYDIDSDSVELQFVGIPAVGLNSNNATIRVLDFAQGFDRIQLSGTWALSNGATISGSAGPDATAFNSPNLEELAGLYSGSQGQFGTSTTDLVWIHWLSIIIEPAVWGEPFCDPMDVNSTGQSTQLTGTTADLPGLPLHLDAHQGPPTQFGYALVGTSPSDPGAPISQGRLCLGMGLGELIGRYNVAGTPFDSLGQFNSLGEFENLSGTSTTGFGFDVPSTLPLPGNPTILAGETWYFQLWHREDGGQSNFSNGLAVTF